MNDNVTAPNANLDQVRRAILDATLELAEVATLTSITFEFLSANTGISVSEIEACFGTHDGFIAALHRHFLMDLIDSIMASSPPGEARLKRSTEAFLNRCVECRNLRRQLVALDAGNPSLRQEGSARRNGFKILLSMELKSMGINSPEYAARLMRSIVEEISYIEAEEGQANPGLREKIWIFLESIRK